MPDPKRNRAKEALAIRHALGLPRRFFCQGIFTSSVLHGLSFKLPPPALGSDARCRADRRPLRLPTGGARAPQASSPQPPPLASLSSCYPERLSSLRGVSGPSPSQKDLGCSERCLPAAS